MSQIDSHKRNAGNSWLDRVRIWTTKNRRHRAASSSPATSPLGMTLAPFAGISADYVWSRFVQLLANDQALRIELDEYQQRQPLDLGDLTSAVTRMVTDDRGADGTHTDVAAWWRVNQEPYLRPTPKVAALCVWLWRNGLHAEAVDVYAKIWSTVRARHRENQRIGWPPDTALEAFRDAAYPHWDDADHEWFCTVFRQRHVDPQIDHDLDQLIG